MWLETFDARKHAVDWRAAPASCRGAAQDNKPQVKIPESGVPQIMTIEGSFVRAAYNNEGYVILGYKTANMSVGDDWMLIEIGHDAAGRRLGREAEARRGVARHAGRQAVALATVEEYRKADLRALENRAKVARDSINYFPPMASRPCRIGFFSDVEDRALPWDDVELQLRPRLPRTPVFQGPGRHQVRPALAERAAREDADPRPVPHPDQGRGKVRCRRTTATFASR